VLAAAFGCAGPAEADLVEATVADARHSRFGKRRFEGARIDLDELDQLRALALVE
jgi:hypothetical protein